jgi:carnitine O-acetyltransferase
MASQKAGPCRLPIGLLTSMSRDSWASAHARLVIDNQETLNLIERAILILCLDDEAQNLSNNQINQNINQSIHQSNQASDQNTDEEKARLFWHGDAANRFYDKPLQFIVTADGQAGLLAEHSMMDGSITHRLCDDVLNRYKF